MSKRTDCHRPGAIIPVDYVQVLDYIMPGSEPFDQFNMKEARELCASVGWASRGEMWGHMGKCGVCGAVFRHGTIYRHVPTGHLVHMGHDCADKYEILADHDDWNAANESLKARRAAVIQAKLNAERRAEQLSSNPGLAEAFECTHYIVQDIKRKFEGSNFSISEKQIALVLKIAREEKEKAARPAEVHVPAPEGRQTFEGVLVSIKSHEGAYGISIKGTIKVTTPDGVWLAWGTLPEALWDNNDKPERGDVIRLTGTLSRGNEPHFAFFKRPTKPVYVERVARVPSPRDTPSAEQFRALSRNWFRVQEMKAKEVQP